MTERTALPICLPVEPVVPVPKRNLVGPQHFSFARESMQPPVTQPPPVASESSYPCPSLIVIPDVSRKTNIPRSEVWKIVVQHWMEGDPRLGLHIALKDWPYEYTHGPNRKLHSKYNQWRTVATEFLEQQVYTPSILISCQRSHVHSGTMVMRRSLLQHMGMPARTVLHHSSRPSPMLAKNEEMWRFNAIARLQHDLGRLPMACSSDSNKDCQLFLFHIPR